MKTRIHEIKKNNIYTLSKKAVFNLAVFISLFTSCISEDEIEPTRTPVVGEIFADATTREINTSVTYPYGNYTLRGMVNQIRSNRNF